MQSRYKDSVEERERESTGKHGDGPHATPHRCVVCRRHFIGGALVETGRAVLFETDDLGPIPGFWRDGSGQLWPWLRESGPRWVCSKECARHLVLAVDFDDLHFADTVYTGPLN